MSPPTASTYSNSEAALLASFNKSVGSGGPTMAFGVRESKGPHVSLCIAGASVDLLVTECCKDGLKAHRADVIKLWIPQCDFASRVDRGKSLCFLVKFNVPDFVFLCKKPKCT